VYTISFPKPIPFTIAFIAENNIGILTTALYNVTVKGLTTNTLVREKYAVPLTLTCKYIQTFYIALIPKENIYVRYFSTYHIFWPIRCTMIFALEILENNNDECILILVIYWKKTGLLNTKISNHNVIYSS